MCDHLASQMGHRALDRQDRQPDIDGIDPPTLTNTQAGEGGFVKLAAAYCSTEGKRWHDGVTT